jgi:hypothetical protein
VFVRVDTVSQYHRVCRLQEKKPGDSNEPRTRRNGPMSQTTARSASRLVVPINRRRPLAYSPAIFASMSSVVFVEHLGERCTSRSTAL